MSAGNQRTRALLRVAGGAVLVLLALAAGLGLDRLRPTAADREGPFIRTAPVGEAVDLRVASLTVVGVRGGRSVLSADRYRSDTEGVFVAVKLRVFPYSHPIRVGTIEVRDGAGNRYLPTTQARQPLERASSIQPGYATEAEVIFEVPADSAPSLRLWAAIAVLDLRADTVADVPLGITTADVAAWRAAPDSLAPEDPAVAS